VLEIVVDANEARCGLADLLIPRWDTVRVRRLVAGDVAIGDRILIERKTSDDFLASLEDGRLFRQAVRIASSCVRPLIVLEGADERLRGRIDASSLRGIELALTVGFRIPVLRTADLAETAVVIRHIAAQEARRRPSRPRPPSDASPSSAVKPADGVADPATGRARSSPQTYEVLLALPGVGKHRARSIAHAVGSVRKLSELSVRELMRIPGVGPDTAARIVDALAGRTDTS